MSTYLVFMVLLPGVLFYVVAGKRDSLDSASGWLVATLVGLLMSALTVMECLLSRDKEIAVSILALFLGEKTGTSFVLSGLLSFMLLTYTSATGFGLIWGRFAALFRLVEVVSSRSGPYTGTRPILGILWMCSPVSRFLEQTGPELGYLVRREAVRRRA